jgi:hypothetical protein
LVKIVVFPSKQAGKVNGFLDRQQIAVVSVVEPNSAGAKFPVVMFFVTPLIEYFTRPTLIASHAML